MVFMVKNHETFKDRKRDEERTIEIIISMEEQTVTKMFFIYWLSMKLILIFWLRLHKYGYWYLEFGNIKHGTVRTKIVQLNPEMKSCNWQLNQEFSFHIFQFLFYNYSSFTIPGNPAKVAITVLPPSLVHRILPIPPASN